MKRKITLTEAQFNFLSDLLEGPKGAVLEWSPARKLSELGFAKATPENFGRATYTVTDTGRAHHRAIYMADKKCPMCKTAPWTCRLCGRKACEHHCGKKGNDGTAICGRKECQEGKPAPVAATPAAPKLSSLSKGDIIVVGSLRLRVTIVDRSTGGIGPLVELEKTAKPNTHYTLMEHAREPGRFVLGSIQQAKVIDGWRKLEAPRASRA